jgi:hypothetical protein
MELNESLVSHSAILETAFGGLFSGRGGFCYGDNMVG